MLTFLHTVISKNMMDSLRMLCCWEEARRYKKCGSHDGQLWHNSCKRIYVLYMSPNKNRKVIFATCYGKIDKPWQVPSTELYHKTSNPLFLFFPLKFQKNFPPSWFTSLYKGGGGCMNTIISLAYMKQPHVLFLEPWEINFSNPEAT